MVNGIQVVWVAVPLIQIVEAGEVLHGIGAVEIVLGKVAAALGIVTPGTGIIEIGEITEGPGIEAIVVMVILILIHILIVMLLMVLSMVILIIRDLEQYLICLRHRV